MSLLLTGRAEGNCLQELDGTLPLLLRLLLKSDIARSTKGDTSWRPMLLSSSLSFLFELSHCCESISEGGILQGIGGQLAQKRIQGLVITVVDKGFFQNLCLISRLFILEVGIFVFIFIICLILFSISKKSMFGPSLDLCLPLQPGLER